MGKDKGWKTLGVLIKSFPIRFKSQNCFQSIIFDLSENKKKELELRKMREQYETFFMNDLSGDFISTPEGRVLNCNPSFLRIFGFSSIEEAKDKDIKELFEDYKDFENVLKSIEKDKKIENLELKMKKLDGNSLDILANLVGIFDEDNNLKQIIGYLLDETKRKQLVSNIERAQAFESLGALAGGIAHDFNNILSIVLGHSELLKKSYNPLTCLEEHQDYINAIFDASQRGISLVKQLLSISRKKESEMSYSNINEIILELKKLVRETFPKSIKLNLNLKEYVPDIFCDETQIYQAILNILVNARDALPKGGEITIRTDFIKKEDIFETFPGANFDNYFLIEISDNGIGMDENTQKNIFNPFFTTKELGKGTGLGLTQVYSIVRNHNGFIDVKSKLGVGTTFQIYLPMKKGTLKKLEEKKDITKIQKVKGKTVLIIEDEEMILKLLENVLKTNGYNILCAKDGEGGLKIFEKNKDKIDCVICDLGLPDLSGEEVLKRILKIKPEIKTILSSGLFETQIKTELSKIGFCEFLQKPFSIDEVLFKLEIIFKT